MNNSTLRDLRRIFKKYPDIANEIRADYEVLITHKQLASQAIERLTRFIAVLLVVGDVNLVKMAYYLSIHLASITNDYTILRDISVRLGYYPVVKLIDRISDDNYLNFDSLRSLLPNIFSEIYKGNFYRTSEQYYFSKKLKGQDNVIAVAPTSYGKSQLMIEKCIDKYRSGKRVCLVIPTKSLLAQTVSEIANKQSGRKNIVTHPDMMSNELANNPHIGVLTQERLMSIIAKYPDMSYDYIFIDEAHDIFSKDQRSLLLARVVIMLKKRNKDLCIDYYSPFIASPETSLNVVGIENEYTINCIDEFIKVPQFYIWNEESTNMSIYDQFLDRSFSIGKTGTDIYSVTIKNSGNKNIIYANKPSDIELIADMLANHLDEVAFSKESKILIDEACNSLSTLVHGSYNLIKLLKHGIVISHGRMTDLVKNYVEYLFREIPELKYIITTSTLLEGVNIPAEKLFIYDYSKGKGNLSSSAFHNLIGRICRFSDIFNSANLDINLLIPKIYMMRNKKFLRQNANVDKFIRSVARDDLPAKDMLSNPLLEEYSEKDKTERRIEEATVMSNVDNKNYSRYESISESKPVMAQTDFGSSCFKNGINFFNIFSFENTIDQRLKQNDTISNVEMLVSVVVRDILEPTFSQQEKAWIYTLYRNIDTRKKITEVLKNRASGDYNFAKLVAFDVQYWTSRIVKKDICTVYVGKIGDRGKGGAIGCFNNYHTFSSNDRNLMASYAVSLEKENLDNIDYEFIPIVETLHDLHKIDDVLYKRLKYGTDDNFIIGLVRLGLDLSLANVIARDRELRTMFAVGSDITCINKPGLLKKMNEMGLPNILSKSADDLL